MTATVPLTGTTLITGPSNVGKTRLTARTLDSWVERSGPDGVVVFEFGPAIEHEGRILGGRLDRFTTVPAAAWHGVLDAHAPRTQGTTTAESVRLARDNAERAARLLREAPTDPAAVFVNDATIPFQHPSGSPDRLTRYANDATLAVFNAFESDELGTDDPVSHQERAALQIFRNWADRVRRLEAG